MRLNGAPLPRDHGAPVRLVVPGWYGCCWIKWVNEIRPVTADHPVTPQMIEFSLRTHQRTVPARALDYEAPVIDLAAMPVRVEKRRIDGRLEYRILGIVWGGDRPVERLRIRFRPGDEPAPFTLCPAPRTHRAWSLWEYRWRPREPGIYSIALAADDPSIRTRRLDVSFYVRRVVIDET
jgi:DMSO/TMAO reductase YedYZ molybdopterin-dependent catalytic subunit